MRRRSTAQKEYTVTKAELVAQVAKNSGVTSRDAETVLNGLRDVVQA